MEGHAGRAVELMEAVETLLVEEEARRDNLCHIVPPAPVSRGGPLCCAYPCRSRHRHRHRLR